MHRFEYDQLCDAQQGFGHSFWSNCNTNTYTVRTHTFKIMHLIFDIQSSVCATFDVFGVIVEEFNARRFGFAWQRKNQTNIKSSNRSPRDLVVFFRLCCLRFIFHIFSKISVMWRTIYFYLNNHFFYLTGSSFIWSDILLRFKQHKSRYNLEVREIGEPNKLIEIL